MKKAILLILVLAFPGISNATSTNAIRARFESVRVSKGRNLPYNASVVCSIRAKKGRIQTPYIMVYVVTEDKVGKRYLKMLQSSDSVTKGGQHILGSIFISNFDAHEDASKNSLKQGTADSQNLRSAITGARWQTEVMPFTNTSFAVTGSNGYAQ